MAATPFRFARIAAVATFLTLAPACASGTESPETTSETTVQSTSTAGPETGTADTPERASASIRLHAPVDVRATPDDTAEVVTSLGERTELGSVTTLLILDARDGWFEVLLPVRPNGTTGWLPASAGDVRSTTVMIDVDLDARRLTVIDGADVVLQSDIAIGAPDTPTPAGRFSVTDLVDTGDSSSPYGPFALGLSAHSDQLTEFAGGDGQVGLHGTNQPDSIGRAVSHGCVRLPNQVIAQVIDLVPLGSPVVVH